MTWAPEKCPMCKQPQGYTADQKQLVYNQRCPYCYRWAYNELKVKEYNDKNPDKSPMPNFMQENPFPKHYHRCKCGRTDTHDHFLRCRPFCVICAESMGNGYM